MKEVKVEVLGPEPACVRCQTAKKAVEKVAEKLGQTGINVKRARAINGVVKIMGRVPKEEEIDRLVREAAK